jgi:Heparinase II/III-like protein/Heparinase II/III N-terminus
MLRRLRQVIHLPMGEILLRGGKKVEREATKFIGRLMLPLASRELSDRSFQTALSCASQGDLVAQLQSELVLPSPIACVDLGEIAELIRVMHPDYAASLIRKADLICEHRFDLLGSGLTHLDLTAYAYEALLPWHTDFKSGYTWPSRAFYRDIRIPYGVADIKVPWELSRFSHAVTLGQAFQLSGDETYLREYVRQVNDWIDHNPARRGVNWACTMDVAIRAANWLAALSLFRGEGRLTDDFLIRIHKSLLMHGRHIRRNLENRGLTTNNHYLANLAGLLYLGVSLPWLSEAEEWKQFAVQELEKEILKQVRADGGVFEASICYHRLSLEMLASCHLVAKRAGICFSRDFEDRLKLAFQFVLEVTTPGGWAPQIGDNDSGRFHRLSTRDELDFSYLITWSALAFDEPGHTLQSEVEFSPEMLWLYGPSAQATWEERTQPQAPLSASTMLSSSGLCTLRHKQQSMVISCGDNGQDGLGGHAHNDKMSFVFRAGDVSLIIDPGTYGYTLDPSQRNVFRGTAYHNTLLVDGAEQNRLSTDKLFSLSPDATVSVLSWQTTSDFDFLDVEHDGYARLEQPVIHRRQFFLDKIQGLWLIRDVLLGSGSHEIGFNLHLPVDAHASLYPSGDPHAVSITHRGASILFASGESSGVSLRTTKGWVSERYGDKQPALVVTCQMQLELPSAFWWIIHPWTGEESVEELRERARAIMSAHSDFLGGMRDGLRT